MSKYSLKVVLAYLIVCVVWGTTFFFIRIGVRDLPPFLMAGMRQASAGLILLAYVWFTEKQFYRKEDLIKMAIPGLLMIALGNGMVSWGETHLNSSLAAILSAMTPLWVLIIGLIFLPKGKIPLVQIIGLLVGFVGVLIIFYPELRQSLQVVSQLKGVGAIIIANLGWAAGTVYVSRNQSSGSPMLAASGQMLIAGLVLLLFSGLLESGKAVRFTPSAVWSLVYLCLFGSVLAYAAFLYMLRHMSATAGSSYAYINTIVAVFLGWCFLEEPAGWNVIIGAACTLFGVYLVRENPKP